MDSELEALLERLIDAGVLAAADDDRLELTAAFREARDARLADAADARARYADTLDADPADLGDEVVAGALAVQSLDEGIDDRDAVVAADAVERFAPETEGEGVPEGAVPLRPSEIRTFLDRNPASVLYFWGPDCTPCDRVSLELEGMVENDMIPEFVGLGAVYLGGDANIDAEHRELIADDWQVAVVPTLLFFSGQSLESRYIGAKGAGAIRREIEILAEYVDGHEVEPMETSEFDPADAVEDVIDVSFDDVTDVPSGDDVDVTLDDIDVAPDDAE